MRRHGGRRIRPEAGDCKKRKGDGSMRKKITMAILAGMLLATPVGAARAAEGASDYGEAAKLMTDSMMKMMGAMFKMYSEMSRPIWSSTAQIFGEYGEWCTTCHAPLDNIYQQLGESFDPQVHKKLSDDDLKKALEAYMKEKKARAGKK